MSETSRKRPGLPSRVKMRHDTHFVDGLAHRHGEPIGKLVPLTALQTDPDQPRTSMGDLTDLTSSIREKGVLEPILVRPLESVDESSQEGAGAGEAPPKLFRIISGERRYHAAVRAGIHQVPVIEMDVGPDEALEIALIENLQRKDLTPFEEADGYKALGERFDYTHEQIARAVGKSRTVITESLSLAAIPPRIRNAAQALGISSKSTLLEVMRLGSEDEMQQLLERISDEGLTRDDLRELKPAQRSGKPNSRRKPYTFHFKAPDKTYNLALSFRKSTVEKHDLIAALEEILNGLRSESD